MSSNKLVTGWNCLPYCLKVQSAAFDYSPYVAGDGDSIDSVSIFNFIIYASALRLVEACGVEKGQTA